MLSNGKAIAYRDIYNHEVDVRNSEQCLRVISNGRSGRYTAPTTKNIESSRSHAIITLFLRTKLDEDGIVQQRESRLHLVDLAGSEFQSETYTGGYRLHEACDADKSLNTLCQVIRFLSATNPPPSYINFHDSLLTRMLKDALGGNSRTSVIVNLHSMDAYYDDSMSTLRFAQNVRKIKNTARVNENVCGVSAEVLQAKIVELNVKLRASEEACKQAESRVGRSSVENTQDGECEKFESMKAQFSTMVQELKSQLNQAELKISMLQLSNTFLVDLKSDVINADEVVKLMNQKYNEAVEEWKRTVSENAIANATDVELLRYNEAVTRLQRELAKKTEQFNAKYLEFEKLNAKVLEIRPLFKYDELQPPLSVSCSVFFRPC